MLNAAQQLLQSWVEHGARADYRAAHANRGTPPRQRKARYHAPDSDGEMALASRAEAKRYQRQRLIEAAAGKTDLERTPIKHMHSLARAFARLRKAA